MKRAWLAWAALLAGCGYVGNPLPPALDIPQRITDLRIVERGDKIVAEFSVPPLTTEGLALKSVRSVELRVGVAPNPFNPDAWAASAKRVEVRASAPGPLSSEVSIQEWIGKEVTVGVRATGPKGKTSDWSNLRNLPIEPPIATPTDFKVENLQQGIGVYWKGAGPKYRVFRAVADAQPEQLGDTDQPQWLDAPVEFGTHYRYYVQAVAGELQQSDVAGPQEITPEDTFAPAVPPGLTAELGTNTIELSWERNTEPRFQGYNLYRSVDGSPFAKIASLITAPTYTDRDVQAGKKYRYTVSAAGTNGRESDRSAPVEIAAQ